MPLTYDQTRLAQVANPTGFVVGEERLVLGHGDDVFRRSVAALRTWQHFDQGWVSVFPPNAVVQPGTEVLVIAHHFGLWSVNACRVVYLLGSEWPSEFKGLSPESGTVPRPRDCPQNRGQSLIAGFAYGTLIEHAEVGEEIFQVSIDTVSGEVSYLVRAVSRERALLAKLGFPIARLFQARFRRDSATAMRRAVSAR